MPSVIVGHLMRPSEENTARIITSAANPRVKWLVSLRKRRIRDDEGVLIVEGYDEVRLALEVGAQPRLLFHCPALVRDRGQLPLAQQLAARGAEVQELGSAAFAKASVRESPDGWLAVVPTPSHNLDELRLSANPLVLVCEGVEKPGNLGAMLRTAEAAGVDAVISASPATDWGNPNVVRASKGTLFAVQVASGTSKEVADWLTSRGLTTVAADPEAVAVVTELDFTGPTAVVVGAEHAGLSALWRASSASLAALPMFGRINSLNVSAAAAVIVYEAVRQRSLGGREPGPLR